MKILIFGGSGMLGHKLVQHLSPRFDVRFTLHHQFAPLERFGIFEPTAAIEHVDAADPTAIRKAIEIAEPDVVINAVGLIKQLPSSGDVISTLTLNSIFPHRLAEFAAEFRFRLITISTDCVFDGSTGGYAEADEPNAHDLYGKSKNLGEVTQKGCLTLRTSIIGRELTSAHSLVDWFLSNRGKTLKGYARAIYSGFPTVIFAGIIGDLVDRYKDLSGLYHVSSEPIDKYRLLCLFKDKFGVGIDIEPDEDFVIDRSLNSDKFRNATGFRPMAWDEMIAAMADDPTPYDKWK
jgi:dTDP-4-dehydrorhamnose reductase